LLVQNFFVLLYKISNKNEQNDRDFPLSGGDEPDMKFSKWTLILIAIGIVLFATLLVYLKHW